LHNFKKLTNFNRQIMKLQPRNYLSFPLRYLVVSYSYFLI